MAAPALEPQGAPPAAPGGGAVGGQSAQTVQQIESLLAQLSQEEPDPQVQHLIQQAQQPMEALQQAVGKDDTEDMSSGLHNPGGDGGQEAGGSPEGGGHPVMEIHIGSAPKTFDGAKKAAMKNFQEKGHFSGSTPKGSKPETQKAKSKAKG